MPPELYPPYADRRPTLPDDPDRIEEIAASVRELGREAQVAVGQEFAYLATDDPPDEALVYHLRGRTGGHGAGYEFYAQPIGGDRALVVSVALDDRAASFMVHGVYGARRAAAACLQVGARDRGVAQPVWDRIRERDR